MEWLLRLLCGPVLSLLYPLFWTIKAINDGVNTRHRPLLIYWGFYSVITLFEYFFYHILQLFYWDEAKLIVNIILTVPYFTVSTYLYDLYIKDSRMMNNFLHIRYVNELLYYPEAAGDRISSSTQQQSANFFSRGNDIYENGHRASSNLGTRENYFNHTSSGNGRLRLMSASRSTFDYENVFTDLNPPEHANNRSSSQRTTRSGGRADHGGGYTHQPNSDA